MFSSSVYELKIFSGIEKTVVDIIVAECPPEPFKKWEILMQQGESPDGKGYIIRSGSVQVLVDDEIIATLKDGDIVGEMALMSEEQRTATVVATSDLETIVLSQEDIFTMIENDQNTINKEIMRRMEENLER